MILVVANLKGGVGKTTSAVFLAEAAAERNERVLLVDSDAQGSAKGWFERAAADGVKLRSEAMALSTPELGRRLASLGGYDTIVIDTPPGNLDVIRAASRWSSSLLSVLADGQHHASGTVSGGGPPPHFNNPGDNLNFPSGIVTRTLQAQKNVMASARPTHGGSCAKAR